MFNKTAGMSNKINTAGNFTGALVPVPNHSIDSEINGGMISPASQTMAGGFGIASDGGNYSTLGNHHNTTGLEPRFNDTFSAPNIRPPSKE